ncbi:ABC transporter permease [Bradyrhizobium sp. LHD-71]|uniref:ABC transporter permease n=1 Tax=Bradyrhizobium sp. LHD-71 TaxID=3072141 RepID=UPI00280F0CE7|nr:ABC transporter permease [Bradyrhizobium sp. LHD-71]MDQ8729132.1 ABC transporter permease [Bradyrhizobium sp. LHD-71]
MRVFRRYPSALIGLALVAVIVLAACFAPLIAPYGAFEVVRGANGGVVRLSPPTPVNWMGTTNQGMDVFSQLIWGARVALMVGLISALGSVLLGTIVGLVSGYFGGWTDEVMMRATDVAFGIPFLPFAMVVISIASPSLALIIALVIFFLWRTTARVIRAQVLTLKTRPFVWAAKAAGAGHFNILFRHIAPNVLPLSFLYIAIGVQAGVMLEAALSFLGFGDVHALSWGRMLNDAFKAGAMRTAWWWVLPPGLALSIFVMSIFVISRAYEEILNPRLRNL